MVTVGMATWFDGYCQEDLQKAPAPSLLQCSWCCQHDDRQNWFCCWRDTSAVVSCMSADEMKTVKYCRTSSSQDWAPGWQEQQNRRRARNLSSVINKSTTNREARNQMFNPYNQPVTLQAFMHFQLESRPKKKLDFTYLERSAASGSPFTHFTAIKSSRFPGR